MKEKRLPHLRWNDNRALSTDLHSFQAEIPAFDHLTGAQSKGEWFIGRSIKLLVVWQFSNIADVHLYER